MAISINWSTKVISVPQSYLTNLGGGIYELNLDQFRLDLKSLEDSEEGMIFPATHNHVTILTLSGVTYARAIEIINSYTVDFEDGTYTVKCVGANHNIGDVKVVDNVSLIIGNAAGLIQVTSGSGLSIEQQLQLLKIYQALMLDPTAPVTTTPNQIAFDDVVIDLVGDPELEIVGTRQP